jgi:hypothetical protein
MLGAVAAFMVVVAEGVSTAAVAVAAAPVGEAGPAVDLMRLQPQATGLHELLPLMHPAQVLRMRPDLATTIITLGPVEISRAAVSGPAIPRRRLLALRTANGIHLAAAQPQQDPPITGEDSTSSVEIEERDPRARYAVFQGKVTRSMRTPALHKI